MKAWIVENIRISEDFNWKEIVFADNYKDAKKEAMQTDLYEFAEDYLNLRIRRFDCMDDTENLPLKEFDYELWKNGFSWEGCPLGYFDEYEDEQKARVDFLKWYSEYYKESESNEIY